MKRILLALLIGGATLTSFSSCTKEYITNPLPGLTYNVDIPTADWKTSSVNSYVATLDFSKELDAPYINFGQVTVAISFDNDKDYFINIPSAVGLYNYRVEYKLGVVNIFADYVGNGTGARPTPMRAKVTFTDGEDRGN